MTALLLGERSVWIDHLRVRRTAAVLHSDRVDVTARHVELRIDG